MKILDTKEGKIAGINFIDLAVLGIALFLAFSFASKVLSQELTFSGDQMYSAITMHQKLDTKGFLIEGDIKGEWISDGSEFHAKGLIVGSKGGALRFKTEEGPLLLVGGSMAYVEDVAASKIVFMPLDRYVVTFYLDPMTFSDYDSFLKYFNGMKEEIGAEHLYLDTELAFNVELSQSDIQDMINSFEAMYLLRDYFIMQAGEEGAIVSLSRVEISELSGLKLVPEKITTGAIDVYAGYQKRPSEVRVAGAYHIASLEELI
jgi:hypothetical protein